MTKTILLDKDKLFRIWGIKEVSCHEVGKEIVCTMDGNGKIRFVGAGEDEKSALRAALISIQLDNLVYTCKHPSDN